MAHLQSALRAYALEALRPELVLERMNSFVLEGEQGGMVTLLYAIVDPDASTLQVATAGHPPPLMLRPEGKPVFAEAPAGSPLGVTGSLPTRRARDARPLVDRAAVHGRAGRGSGAAAGPGARGPSRYRRERAARARGAVPRRARRVDFAGGLSRRPRPAGHPADPARAETLALALPARPASLASMRRAVAQWLRLAGASEAEVYEMLVACWRGVRERGRARSSRPLRFVVRASRRAQRVRRSRSWFATPARGDPRARRAAGVGSPVMRELMDDVDDRALGSRARPSAAATACEADGAA